MKRTPLKRRSRLKPSGKNKAKKGKPLRKKSKSASRVLQDKIWELCKSIIRRRYGNVCYTCGKEGLSGSNWHTGHFIPKATLGAYLKYDLRVLRPQCYFCNINAGGAGAVFYANMVKEMGQEHVDRIFEDMKIIVKANEHYIKILEEYKQIDINEQTDLQL